jgi:Methyltransferase domain
MFPEAAARIGELLANISDSVVLNVGSSTRQFYCEQQPYIWNEVMQPLLERGNALINIDAKSQPGVHLVRDVADLQLTNMADIVLCCNILEHVVDPSKVLRGVHLALKTTGHVVIESPVAYPYHADPIDTMFRIGTMEQWDALMQPIGFSRISFELLVRKAAASQTSVLVAYQSL